MLVEILGTVGVLGGLGVVFGIGLAKASKVFHVPVDPRVEKLIGVLPGANCGGCGKAGCTAFAKALTHGSADPGGCKPGGEETALQIANILGIHIEIGEPEVAYVKCRGTDKNDRFIYDGVPDCRAANHPFYFQGPITCSHGCLGFGTCVTVCQFDALHMGEDGVPVVDVDKCTACGACVEICPRDIIELAPKNAPIEFKCVNPEKGKDVLDVCGRGCISCGKCVRACKFGALTLENGLITIDRDLCKGCGLCVKACPTGALQKTGRRAPKKKKKPAEDAPAPAAVE